MEKISRTSNYILIENNLDTLVKNHSFSWAVLNKTLFMINHILMSKLINTHKYLMQKNSFKNGMKVVILLILEYEKDVGNKGS